MRHAFLAAIIIIVTAVTIFAVAHAQIASLMAAAGASKGTSIPPQPPATITGVTVAGGTTVSYTSGVSSGTSLGAIAVQESGGTFSGTLALGGTNASDFALSATALPANLDANSSTPTCTSTTNYSITITPTQAGAVNSGTAYPITVTCNPASSAPAAALAGCQTANGGSPTNGSCFSTMVLDLDFSGNTACTNTGCAFPGHPANYYQTLSNWLECPGTYSPSTPEWENDTGGNPSTQPGSCSNYAVVNDGGTMALQMTGTQADYNNGAVELTMATGGPNASASSGFLSLPVGSYYLQFTFRKTPITNNGADIWAFHGTQFYYQGANANSYCGSSSCYVAALEQDYMENLQSGGTVEDAGGWLAYFTPYLYFGDGDIASNNNSGTAGPPSNYVLVPSPAYDPTSYVTYGERFTTDGNNVARCWYYSPGNTTPTQQLGCELVCSQFTSSGSCPDPLGRNDVLSDNGGNNSVLYDRNDLVNWVSNQNNGSANAYLYLANEQVWSCPNWNTGYSGTGNPAVVTAAPCAGVVLTTNP